MKLKKLSPRKKDCVFCILIVLLGALLRLYHYSSIPVHNWTADEYAFAWSGMSLIKDHVPTSWSYLQSYSDFNAVTWRGAYYRLVTPWFDHPPFFSLIVGSAAILGGADSFFDVTLSVIRIPSLIFSIASIFLLYSLSRRLFNTKIAILSSIIFATNPALVFLSRLAVSENFIIFLTLLCLLCFLEYFKTSKSFYLYVSIFLAGIASISKVTGIFLVFLLGLLLLYKKKWRKSIIALGIGLFIFSTYFIYGSIYNPRLFMAVLSEHSSRFKDILIFKNLIFQTGNTVLPFFDIWMAFSWLALILVFNKTKKKIESKIIFLPIIIYIFVLFLSGAQSHFYPWYFIPLYPFLSIILGIYFYKFMKNSDFLNASLILVFIGSWFINYLYIDPQWQILPLHNFKIFKYIFIFITSSILLPFLLHSILPSAKTKWLKDAVATYMLIFLIISNVIIVYKYPNVLT